MAPYGEIEAKSLAKPPCKGFFVAQILLRSLIAMLTIAGIIVMIKSHQSTTVFDIEFQAKYQYSSAFRYLVGVDITICALALASLVGLCFTQGRPNSWSSKGHIKVFLYDLIATLLMLSGCAAATAVGYIGRYGQDQTGWTKICDNVPKFCNFVTASLALSYISFICLFALTIMAFKRATRAAC